MRRGLVQGCHGRNIGCVFGSEGAGNLGLRRGLVGLEWICIIHHLSPEIIVDWFLSYLIPNRLISNVVEGRRDCRSSSRFGSEERPPISLGAQSSPGIRAWSCNLVGYVWGLGVNGSSSVNLAQGSPGLLVGGVVGLVSGHITLRYTHPRQRTLGIL